MNEFRTIIGNNEIKSIDEKVTELLNDGWELAGPMMYHNVFIQPMVKYQFPKNQFPMVMGHCSKCCTQSQYNPFRGPTC